MTDLSYEEEEFTTNFNGRTFLRILAQTKPHWKMVTCAILAVMVVAILDGYFTFLSKRIIDEGIGAGNFAALREIVITYGSLVLVQAVGVFTFIYLITMLGERVRYDLRKKLFDHLQDLSLSYYSRTPVGWIMSRVNSDTDRVTDVMTWGMADSAWAITNIASSAYFMFRINPRLAPIVLLILPLLFIVSIWFRKRILGEYRRVRKLNSKITGAYNENIQGVRVVKALGREAENLNEFSGLTGDMYRSSYRAAWLSALFLPIVQIISSFAVGTVVYLGAGLELGGFTAGALYSFLSYITSMMWPISDIARVYAEIQNSVASAERMFSLLDAVPEISDREQAIDPGSIRGDIEFDHVDFYYEEGKPVLSDFNMSVRRGETIALVGPTGGGKSTIVNLICRFYEPKHGQIRIGGMDYTAMTLQAIQSRIGVVLQTPHLFSGNIRENIRYGKLAATDDEVVAAAKTAGADSFITTLSKGYDEEVGEGGNLLSTGQKQLISLARAVLADPEIFVMDEATSSVDTLTESLIQKGMENLMEGRTSFIIAHRLSTIKKSDRILVIENGKISEVGTHTELLRKRGHYYNLYTRQFRHQLEQDYNLDGLTGAQAGSAA